MLFCEVSKAVGWKSQVESPSVVLHSFMHHLRIFGLGSDRSMYLLLLTVAAIVPTTLACFLWSVDVREY